MTSIIVERKNITVVISRRGRGGFSRRHPKPSTPTSPDKSKSDQGDRESKEADKPRKDK